MKYYILDTIRVNRKEIGVSPQSIGGSFGDIQNHLPFDGIINFTFKLPIPKLDPKAIRTTFLNITGIPSYFLVVHSSFIDFIKDYSIGNYQFWPLEVRQANEVIKDYCLFFLNDSKQNELVDFGNSEFYVGSLKNHKLIDRDIIIEDYENYLNTFEVLREDSKWLKHRRITLSLEHCNLDLFKIVNFPGSGHYFSERIIKAMRKERFTGMSFKELSTVKGLK